MSEQEKLVLAIDIGGSKFVVGFMTFSGEIRCQQRYVWKVAKPESVLTEVVEKIRELYAQYPEYAKNVVAAGMTIPGIANPKTGMWVSSGFMGADHVLIGPEMEKLLGVKVYIDNDCKACALAESYFGAGKGLKNFFYLTVSNGVGGAAVINGDIYYGAAGRSAELGCCIIEDGGRLSDEGTIRGNVEMYACGRGLVKNYLEAGGELTYNGKPVDGFAISELAKAKDPAALKALEREAFYLGRSLSWASCLFDPELIIIGGGISMMFDLYRDMLNKQFYQDFGIGNNQRIKIVPTPLGYFGALMGAGSLALRGLKGLPDTIPDID